MSMEQQIKLAAKMYRCRDTVKRLHGNDYKSKIKSYQDCISAFIKKHPDTGEIEAAMKIVDEVKDMEGAGIFTMNILAAAVEILEPTK
jgi:hypothetical protein